MGHWWLFQWWFQCSFCFEWFLGFVLGLVLDSGLWWFLCLGWCLSLVAATVLGGFEDCSLEFF